MSVQGFEDCLFDGSLDFPCTYTPKGDMGFASKAILAFTGFDNGQEAGKGLNRAAKQASAEWRHFRMPASIFKSRGVTPTYGDVVTDDDGVEFIVQTCQQSKAGTWMIYAKANGRYKGPESGITRL